MTPINRHIIEFWDRRNAFLDLDETEKYCFKISASYCSTTPSYARLKIVEINRATPPKHFDERGVNLTTSNPVYGHSKCGELAV